MIIDYVIYPETRRKIADAGLQKRIDEKIRSRGQSYVSYSELMNHLCNLELNGFYADVPRDEFIAFRARIVRLAAKDSLTWGMQRTSGPVTSRLEAEHVANMMGVMAAEIVRPDEVPRYREFGFDSLEGFLGSVGATVLQASLDPPYEQNREHRWETDLPDGRRVISLVTGDGDADLWIQRDDITPYPTTDPLGNPVSYRPQFREDIGNLSSYHSVEPSLLVAILKWAEQGNIDSELLRDRGIRLIDFARSRGQAGGTTAEHLFEDERPQIQHFVHFDSPMLTVGGDYKIKPASTPYILPGGTTAEHYAFFMGPKRELIVGYIPNRGEAQVAMAFQPEEVDPLLRSLIVQAASGKGRTSADTLVKALNFRYSDNFTRNMNTLRSSR